MNPNLGTATEGNNPRAAAERPGALIDQIVQACPDTIVLVAMPISTTDYNHQVNIAQYQSTVPGIVGQRHSVGHKVMIADFIGFPLELLRDGIHPSETGYDKVGEIWFNYINQIPTVWVDAPIGPDPERDESSINANGGVDTAIPPPNWGDDPVKPSSKDTVRQAANAASNGGALRMCKAFPVVSAVQLTISILFSICGGVGWCFWECQG